MRAVLLTMAVAALACGATTGSAGGPSALPTTDEVRTFLSQVGDAAATDEGALRRFVEGGAAYPADDFAMLRAAEFWKLRPALRVKRLGPDAFVIRLLPQQQPQTQGAITVRTRLELAVRRGSDGQLRILSREETERLRKMPVPDDPAGEPVVALDFPEEGDFGREAGKHFATEFWAEASGDRVCLSLRFDPPLTGPRLRADVPVSESFAFGDEVRLEISLDADADEATGFRMEELYRRLPGDNVQRTQEWRGFGTDAKLEIDGKKFVRDDGTRAWGLRARLRKVAAQVESSGGWTDRGEVLLEKTRADSGLVVAHDVLTLAVPAATVPMRPGGAYRLMLEHNSGHGLLLKARKGRAGAGCGGSTRRG